MANGNGLKTVFRSALTEVSDTARDTVGDTRWDQDGKRYKYVQYSTGTGVIAAVAGQMAFYLTGGGFTVTSDVSDTIGIGCGMLMSAPANNQYCWVQTGGEATMTIALVSGAAGNALCVSATTDGTLKIAAAVTDAVCAYSMNVAAKRVMLDCPA